MTIFLTDTFSILYLHGKPKHNPITDKNTFKFILLPYGNGIFPNAFTEYLYTFIINTFSKARKRTHQIHWIVTNNNTHNTDGTILTCITDLSCFLTALRKTKVQKISASIKHIASLSSHHSTTYILETHTNIIDHTEAYHKALFRRWKIITLLAIYIVTFTLF